METIFQLNLKELTTAIKTAIIEIENEKVKNANFKSLSIHQVAKRLGRAHATIKKYVEHGLLSTTKDGRIPENELERFLESEN